MVQAALSRNQHTLASEVTLSGVGLFSAQPVTITIKPAEANTGIRFVRMDLPGSPSVAAHVNHVVPASRRTALAQGEARVELVEHILSAMAGLGIDNAVVETDAPELPAGDGSAAIFADAILSARTMEQSAMRAPLRVTEPVTLREGDSTITALPSDADTTEYLYVLDHGDSGAIPRQVYTYSLCPGDYAERIAPARTFSTETDARALWDAGHFRHLTTKDMLVIGMDGPIDNVLRFDDEPVRHKLLDLIGDLSLTGRPIQGRILAVRSGHSLNQALAKKLLDLEARQNARGSTITPEPAMDINRIMSLLPHRYPMILVDRVLEMEEDQRAVGVKNVTINEPFFQGHYPVRPIMPGVLIVEAMCQLAGLMLSQKLERTGKIAMLLSLEGVKLRKPVTPGDQLVLEAEVLKANSRFGETQCYAFVAGELAAEARVKFLMVDAEA